MKKALFIGGLVGTSLMNNVCAQDALSVSEAGEEAAEARAKANETVGYYNLQWGDLRLRAGSGLTVEGDDNVNLVSTNRVGDFIFQPSVNAQVTYPISQQNSLNFNIAVGYSAHVREQYLDQFFVNPGTALAFDIFIKDFVINVHDFFTVTEQSSENPAAASLANYSYLENSSGLRALWDLDKLRVTAAYDHLIRYSLDSADGQEDSSQDLFSLQAGTKLNSNSEFGVEASTGIIKYDQNALNGGIQYSAGLYYRLRLSQNFSLRADGGYTIDNLNNPTAISTNFQKQANTFYYSLSLEHQLNEHFGYSLKVGHGVNAGLFSDTLDLYYARLESNINIVRRCQLKLWFSYENGSETGGLGESFERYGVGGGISRAITQKLSAALNYYFWDRFSDLPDRAYTENQILLNLTYNF
ncbi:MAG: hypothetical protein ABSH48_10790 [Verrucomicrobiota bacterium]|jgi:hypothetical protein